MRMNESRVFGVPSCVRRNGLSTLLRTRWVAQARDASLIAHLHLRRGPVRRAISILQPTRDRGFVAPIENLRHDNAMCAPGDEAVHRLLVVPDCACPKDEAHFA